MNKPYTHSLQDDQIICRMYLDGASLFEISNTMKISNSTIDRILRKNNISRTRNPYIPHKTTELIAEYESVFLLDQYTPFMPVLDYKWCDEKYCSTYFDTIDNHDKAYMLGLFYADGNMKDDYTFSITLQERDVNLLDNIKDILHIDHLLFIPTKNPNWQNGYKLAIHSKRMNDALKHH